MTVSVTPRWPLPKLTAGEYGAISSKHRLGRSLVSMFNRCPSILMVHSRMRWPPYDLGVPYEPLAAQTRKSIILLAVAKPCSNQSHGSTRLSRRAETGGSNGQSYLMGDMTSARLSSSVSVYTCAYPVSYRRPASATSHPRCTAGTPSPSKPAPGRRLRRRGGLWQT